MTQDAGINPNNDLLGVQPILEVLPECKKLNGLQVFEIISFISK